MVTRSPSVHPGDGTVTVTITRSWINTYAVMTARAIGRPPQDKMCAFRDLKNVIVFPAIGEDYVLGKTSFVKRQSRRRTIYTFLPRRGRPGRVSLHECSLKHC